MGRKLPDYMPGPYEPCPCESKRPAKFCCRRSSGIWQRKPVELQAASGTASLAACYASHLGNCSGPISSEHFVSASILREFGDSVEVSGFYFTPDGQSKRLNPKSLGANILCRGHNQILGSLDDRALELAKFARAMCKASDDPDARSTFGVFAGEDIERFMLKMLAGAVVSRALRGRREVSKDQPGFQTIVRVLFGLEPMPEGVGLYVPYAEGKGIAIDESITCSVVTFEDKPDTVASLELRLFGLQLVLSLSGRPIPGKRNYYQTVYRPGYLLLEHLNKTVRHLQISWQGEARREGIEYRGGFFVNV